MRMLTTSFCLWLSLESGVSEDAQQADAVLERKVRAYLHANPSVAWQIEVRNVARESLVGMFRLGAIRL